MTELESTAQKPEPVTVPISRVVVDQRYQVRKRGTDLATVKRYATVLRNGRELPAITLALIGGVYVCVDGFHRVAAHRRAGRNDIQAVVVTATEKEAAWLAASANLAHGLPLKSREVHEAFKRYVRAGHHYKKNSRLKSYREMADDLGGLKSHTTIRNWMEQDFPSVFRKLGGSDGYADRRFPKEAAQATPFEHARAAVEAARNHAAGVTDPDDREALGTAIEAALAEVRTAQRWKPQEQAPF